MTADSVLSLAREAIMVVLLSVAPIVGSGLLIGLTVSVFQATTQIQEPTLSFVPKIIAVFTAIMIFGHFVLKLVTQFTLDLWNNLGGLPL